MTSPAQIGRYEVLAELGGGAMGMVFLARDTVLKRQVALKTFRRPASGSDDEYEQQRKRLLREARSAASLSHPHVVGIYDVLDLDAEGGVFIAMEYVPGTSLEKRMAERPLATHETLRLLGQMAEALDYVHQRGFVHRDIKPSNVLIDEDEQVKLADFGIALPELLDDTLETTVFGTPQYMAPEQILGKAMDARTDIFALGVLVFEMLTGEKPFGGETVPEVARNILSGAVVAAEGRMPFGLGAVLKRSLALRPEDRYASAGEFALAVREALRADPDSTLVSGPVKTAGGARPPRRSRVASLALIGAAGVLAVAVGLAAQRMLARAETDARAAGYAHVLAEAQGQIDAGDPEAAAMLFATAARLADDPREAQDLRAAALRRAAQLEDERAASAAAAALGAGAQPSRTATGGEPTTANRPPAAARAPAGPEPEIAEPAGPEAAPAGPAVLIVDIVSEASAGIVVLYRDGHQVLSQPFDFYERHSWFRKIPTGGHLRQEVSLEPGRMTLRVLLARRNEPGEMSELPAALEAGERGRLALLLPAAGKPLVRLESGRPAPPAPSPER